MTSKKPGPTPPKRRRALSIAGAVLALVLLIAIDPVMSAVTSKQEVPLTEAIALVQDKKVSEAEIVDQTTLVLKRKGSEESVTATFPYPYSDTLTRELLRHDVEVKATAPSEPNPVVRLLVTLLPIFLIGGLLIWLTRSGAMTGGVGMWGKGRGQQMGEIPTTRFSDVAGVAEAKSEMQELVAFLKEPDAFTRSGAKAPRGALLAGPPGTGKTLLARAVAGEAGVPFFAVAGSDFVETFVGVGAKRARDLFDRAKAAGSAIIFIDEIDAVGRKRGGSTTPGDSERENTLISMLNEMDGFDTEHRIIVLAATNRAELLDDALTRPGRLDRRIHVGLPDRRGRSEVLAVHVAGKPVDPAVDLDALARRTPGMSGADLAQLVNEACMEAARTGRPMVDATCFDNALATVALGRARTSALVTDSDRRITAWHEAGHTLAALLQPHADDPVSVSIIPRGAAGGVTWMSGNDNVYLTRDAARAELRTAMAGRVAEEILLDGQYTQGAQGDLQSATSRALAMVTQYGMGATYLQVDAETLRMGGPVAVQARDEAESLLKDAYSAARELLHSHHPQLEALAQALLDEDTLDLAQIRAVVAASTTSAGTDHAAVA